jgi:hypothetical protein
VASAVNFLMTEHPESNRSVSCFHGELDERSEIIEVASTTGATAMVCVVPSQEQISHNAPCKYC